LIWKNEFLPDKSLRLSASLQISHKLCALQQNPCLSVPGSSSGIQRYQTTNQPSRSIPIGWAFFVSGETRSSTIKKGDTTRSNNTHGNQFREDEIIILDQLRDGKWVKKIFHKIGGRLRLAH
jgi:hypothetical protein